MVGSRRQGDEEKKSAVKLPAGTECVERWVAEKANAEQEAQQSKPGGAPPDVKFTRKVATDRKLQRQLEIAEEVAVLAEVAVRDANERLLTLIGKKDATGRELAEIRATFAAKEAGSFPECGYFGSEA